MSRVSSRRCGTCRFFESDGSDHWGRCHRFPPQKSDGGAYFPNVKRDEWCGEWKDDHAIDNG